MNRAVDQHGNMVDFLLRQKRDQGAALRFLRKAIVTWLRPTNLTLDQYQQVMWSPKNFKGMGYLKRPEIHIVKWLTNFEKRSGKRGLKNRN